MKKPEENPNGLHQKYVIRKLVKMHKHSVHDTTGYTEIDVDENSEYFVLRLDSRASDKSHLKACRIGVHAYAHAIEHHLPQLAADLRKRYPLIP